MVEKCLANRRIIKKMQGRGDGEEGEGVVRGAWVEAEV